jgi:hypothetical protein
LSFDARFLTVIPKARCDVQLDRTSANYPFLAAILAQKNRLKACIVTGDDMRIGLYLFKGYQPCSIGMWTVMQLANTARLISNRPCVGVCMHPYAEMPTSSRNTSIEVNDDIKSLLIAGARIIPQEEDLDIPPFLGVEVILPPKGVPSYYFKSLVAEALAIVRPAAQIYMRCKNLEERELTPMSVRLNFYCATVSEAMIAGEAVSVAMGFDTKETGLTLDTLLFAGVYRLRPRSCFWRHGLPSPHKGSLDKGPSATIYGDHGEELPFDEHTLSRQPSRWRLHYGRECWKLLG